MLRGMPDDTPAAAPGAPETPAAPAPVPDLQKQFETLQKQHEQAMAALAAIQAERGTPPPAPEPVAITPEFQAQADAFFKTQLQPFLQQMDQRLASIGGWQSGQQLRQLSQEIELPTDVETEIGNLMQQYAAAGKPLSHQTATRHILGMREENRLRQEVITKRSKQTFNTSMLPAFSGSGGLPNLQPRNGQRPKDNDIQGWNAFAEANDMPLS